MHDRSWMDELNRRAGEDQWYQLWLQDAIALEPGFRALRESLAQAQQDLLDNYISACENMESARTLIAYELGREHGQIIVAPPGYGKTKL